MVNTSQILEQSITDKVEVSQTAKKLKEQKNTENQTVSKRKLKKYKKAFWRIYPGVAAYLTLFFCLAITKTIFGILDNVIQNVYKTTTNQSNPTNGPDLEENYNTLKNTFIMIMSTCSAISRFLTGILLDFMLKRGWIETPFPFVVFFAAVLALGSFHAAFSLKTSVKNYIVFFVCGGVGGVYAMMPLVFSYTYGIENFMRQYGYAEIIGSLGVVVFGIIARVCKNKIALYFGICGLASLINSLSNFLLALKFRRE